MDAVWMLVAALTLACAVLGWLLLRKGRREPPPAVPAEPRAAAPAVTAPSAASAGPTATAQAKAPAAPVAPPVVPPRPAGVVAAPPAKAAPAAVPAAAPAATVTVARALRFELRDDAAADAVMRLERTATEAWSDAVALEPTPMQRDALARLTVHAARLEPGAVGDNADLFVLRLRRASALPLSRGRLGGAPAAALQSQPAHALDPGAAAQAAAVTLALHCSPVYLGPLRARVSETKSVAATLHPKLLTQGEGRLKSLMQDLTRYLREAEENYAGAVRKPVFVGRVAETCRVAETLWRELGDAVATLRAQIDAQVRAPRFGEVQLEKSLAALRELQGQRRVQDVASRVLAGWQMLRLALGEASPAAAAALRDAAAALRSSDAADSALAEALGRCIDAAPVPDYVGKAEFVANRQAARELLQRIATESLEAAATQLAQAADAIGAGFAGDAPLALLLKLDAHGRPAELRRPAL